MSGTTQVITSGYDLSIENRVAQITFNRADKRNSLLPAFWTEFPKTIKELSERGDVRCIVIQAEGKVFSAGMDLSVFASPGKFLCTSPLEREHLRNVIISLQDSLTVLEKARIPIIAAVQGGCLGAGLDLVAACDIRYCTADAYFCIQEINIGILADMGTLQRLPRKMPDGLVRELAFTGERLPAERAKDCGFVNDIFLTQNQMREHAMKVAQKIAGNAPLVVSASKECLNYSADHTIEDSLRYCANVQSFIFDAEEVAKQFQSTNNPPEFKDLKPVSQSL